MVVLVLPVVIICLIFIAGAHPVIGAASVTDDVAPLYAFGQALKDHNQILTNWDPLLVDSTTWWRVVCDNKNRAIKLNLGCMGLSGKLVGDLGKVTKLEHVLLNNNRITGTIPSEFGNLTNLLDLDLNNNLLSGSIPVSFGNLKTLKFLRLNDNKLGGSIPNSLTGLDKLLVLNLSNNQLKGPIPSGLFNLKSLRYLDLTNNVGLKGGPCAEKPCYFNNFG